MLEKKNKQLIVKEGINVRVESSGFKNLLHPDSNYYKNMTYFYNGDSACKYILNLV